MKRRDFFKKSTMVSTGFAIGGKGFSIRSYASIIGANDRINLAVIGIRNQGLVHIKNFCALKNSHNVNIKTLCDTEESLFASRSKVVDELNGNKPLTEWDLRKVLDDKDIDAVSIVTPNHWHALEYGQKMKQKYDFLPENSYNITENRLIYPIPYRETQVNPDLQQNPGY